MFVCLFICFFLVENFYVYFLEFNNCVCKFDKNKNKNLLKKKTCSAGIGDTIINATSSDGIREIFHLLSCLDQQYVLFSIATSR